MDDHFTSAVATTAHILFHKDVEISEQIPHHCCCLSRSICEDSLICRSSNKIFPQHQGLTRNWKLIQKWQKPQNTRQINCLSMCMFSKFSKINCLLGIYVATNKSRNQFQYIFSNSLLVLYPLENSPYWKSFCWILLKGQALWLTLKTMNDRPPKMPWGFASLNTTWWHTHFLFTQLISIGIGNERSKKIKELLWTVFPPLSCCNWPHHYNNRMNWSLRTLELNCEL